MLPSALLHLSFTFLSLMVIGHASLARFMFFSETQIDNFCFNLNCWIVFSLITAAFFRVG